MRTFETLPLQLGAIRCEPEQRVKLDDVCGAPPHYIVQIEGRGWLGDRSPLPAASIGHTMASLGSPVGVPLPEGAGGLVFFGLVLAAWVIVAYRRATRRIKAVEDAVLRPHARLEALEVTQVSFNDRIYVAESKIEDLEDEDISKLLEALENGESKCQTGTS